MSNSDWSEVSESVDEMVDALNSITHNTNRIRAYLDNLDASKIKKTDAALFQECVHLCDVMDSAQHSMGAHAVQLFNVLQQAKGRSTGW